MRISIALLFAAALVACGGGSDEPAEFLTVGSSEIRVAAGVALAWAPGVDELSPRTPCDALNITATFTASPPPLPTGFQVSEVVLLREGQRIWAGQVEPEAFFLQSPGEAHAIAGATCAPAGLLAEQRVVVVYKITYEGLTTYLKTAPVTVREVV